MRGWGTFSAYTANWRQEIIFGGFFTFGAFLRLNFQSAVVHTTTFILPGSLNFRLVNEPVKIEININSMSLNIYFIGKSRCLLSSARSLSFISVSSVSPFEIFNNFDNISEGCNEHFVSSYLRSSLCDGAGDIRIALINPLSIEIDYIFFVCI